MDEDEDDPGDPEGVSPKETTLLNPFLILVISVVVVDFVVCCDCGGSVVVVLVVEDGLGFRGVVSVFGVVFDFVLLLVKMVEELALLLVVFLLQLLS